MSNVGADPRRICTLIPFCYRQFEDPNYSGSRIDVSKEDFDQKLNHILQTDNIEFKPGYAPFCVHAFVKNFTSASVGTLQITPENEHLLRSGYSCRTEKELAVLERWFPRHLVSEDQIPRAEYLDIILYSREQINKESHAMKEDWLQYEPWGVVGIKAQNEDYELPMSPITMMRNSLGVGEGGSGVDLDREKYQQSVEYWSVHANIK